MAARHTPPRSLGQRRASAGHDNIPRSVPQALSGMPSRMQDMSSSDSHPKPLPTPGKSASPLPSSLLPSAPASPPTPAPSPTPHHTLASWQAALEDDDEEDDSILLKTRIHFSSLSSAQKQKFLVDILNICDNQQLSFISSFISPRLRKDPFTAFPNEICLRVRDSMIDYFRLAHSLIRWRHNLGPLICRRRQNPRPSFAGIETME